MLGLMQDWPLLCHRALDHAASHHGDTEIVSRSIEGPIVRETYAEAHLRARKCAQALQRMGIGLHDRVGTLAWNTHRHFEALYGISGIGAIYHTINPRLFPDQIAYIINHAEDKAIFVDLSFVGVLAELQGRLSSVKQFIVLTDRAHMPKTTLRGAMPYEDFIAQEDGDFSWAEVDERTAAGLCYTSGTTGNPKGVLYSHRSLILHAMAINSGDVMSLSPAQTVLTIVPMFHVNAWCLPFAAPAAGSKLVLPGAKLDGESVCELIEKERVTFAVGVPTVWLMMLQHLEKAGRAPATLRRAFAGGAAVPRSMIETFEKRYGIELVQGWGMTETSPVGTVATLKPRDAQKPGEERFNLRAKQGRAIFTVDMKIVDDDGKELARDGKTSGYLKVRGPAVAAGYFKGEGSDVLDEHGFFSTGDIATIDPNGYMQITDRAKDVIKSGGEWISSIEIENAMMGHPDVAEAAVIGVAHPKWTERPLLVVVPKEGARPAKEHLLGFLSGKIAKWWMPDDVVFVKELPHTGTGKLQKRDLKVQFKDYKLPTA
ncbi:MAG: long-chain-fatty-acid--CoA ligase [Alphaproteobacteria bacterium]